MGDPRSGGNWLAARRGLTPEGAEAPLLVLGEGSVLPLAHRALAGWALRGAPQVVVDCGGFFDPYGLARAAREMGARPEAVLERVRVARAFTGYQEIRALLNLRRQFSPGTWVYLLNPLFPLLDGDLPEGDRHWIFRRLMKGLSWFSRAGYPLRVCQESGRGGTAFLQTLAHRLPVMRVDEGRIEGERHGQERAALFQRGGPAGGRVRPLPARDGEGRSASLRPAVQ